MSAPVLADAGHHPAPDEPAPSTATSDGAAPIDTGPAIDTGPTVDPGPVDPAQALDALVLAAVAGDRRARELLMVEIQPLVQRYCRGRLGRSEGVLASADDVAQEVCAAVITALPNYQLKGLSFRAFVYGIAAHKVTDAFRAIGRNRTEPVADLPDAPFPHDGPEQQVLLAELTGAVGDLLQRLTARQREVLVLRIAVGLSAEETAQAVGSTPGAVRVTQHRALCRLRAIIGGVADTQDGGSDVPADRPGTGRAPVRPTRLR